jgi:hypothetical protein
MTSLDDLSGIAGNWAGVVVGTGIAVGGANMVMGQLGRLSKPTYGRGKKHKGMVTARTGNRIKGRKARKSRRR